MKIVCVTPYFDSFTYGKEYEVIEDKGSYFLLINDYGKISSPSKIEGFTKKPYFISVEEYKQKLRDYKINQLI